VAWNGWNACNDPWQKSHVVKDVGELGLDGSGINWKAMTIGQKLLEVVARETTSRQCAAAMASAIFNLVLHTQADGAKERQREGMENCQPTNLEYIVQDTMDKAAKTLGSPCGISKVAGELKKRGQNDLAKRLSSTNRSRRASAHPDTALASDIAVALQSARDDDTCKSTTSADQRSDYASVAVGDSSCPMTEAVSTLRNDTGQTSGFAEECIDADIVAVASSPVRANHHNNDVKVLCWSYRGGELWPPRSFAQAIEELRDAASSGIYVRWLPPMDVPYADQRFAHNQHAIDNLMRLAEDAG